MKKQGPGAGGQGPGETDRRRFITHTVGALAGIALVPESHELFPAVQGGPLRVGIIGTGRQGRAIVTELQKIDQVQIGALCDTSAARLKTAAERVKDAATYPDHGAMLAAGSDIKAVIIATPTHTHREIVLDCLKEGRHVFCEAPVAATVEDCQALIEAASSAKSVAQAGFQGRSNPPPCGRPCGREPRRVRAHERDSVRRGTTARRRTAARRSRRRGRWRRRGPVAS